MPEFRRICVLLAGFFYLVASAYCQSVTIQSITISGLERTKPSIVYRELNIKEGDTIPQNQIGQILQRNKDNVLNLGLFNEVIVNVSEWDTDLNLIDITIDVKESWYIYALPIFDLADRNFNVWWTTYNHALNRINLGARLEWLNFSGHNDKLKAKLQFGYTPQQQIEYRFPYFGKRKSLGLTTAVSHSINKEVNYATADNHEMFVRYDEDVLKKQWSTQISTFYRPSIFIRYELAMGYQYIHVDERVVEENNPIFFRNGENTHSALSFRFAFDYDDRDLKIYPSKGTKALFEIEKIGMGAQADENSLVTRLAFEWNITSGKRFQHRISSLDQYSLSRSRPSYMYYQGLGSGKRYINGYELYVINGLDYFEARYTLAYKLLEVQTKIGTLMPFEQFRRIPIAIYLSVYGDGGYVYDPFTGDENSFGNRWLYAGGSGLSVLMYNNFLFQFNYTVNHLGEWGLYLHNSTSF